MPTLLVDGCLGLRSVGAPLKDSSVYSSSVWYWGLPTSAPIRSDTSTAVRLPLHSLSYSCRQFTLGSNIYIYVNIYHLYTVYVKYINVVYIKYINLVYRLKLPLYTVVTGHTAWVPVYFSSLANSLLNCHCKHVGVDKSTNRSGIQATYSTYS